MTMTIDYDEFQEFEDNELELDESPIVTQDTSHEEDFFEPVINNDESSFLNTLLNSKGISDPNNILILDEDGKEITVKFSDLSDEEKLQILSTEEPVQYKESELETFLKEENMSLDQFLDAYREQILNENSTQNYTIDNYTDEELFMLDLQSKFDLTDEELQSELEKELQNPDLFKKKTDKLREEYKASEDAFNQQQQAEFEAENQRRYDEFAQTMSNVAYEITDIYDTVELEDSDKEEVLKSILELDEQGTSEFGKLINDPKNLYQAAWFLKYGRDAFDALKSYYTSEIAKLNNQIKKPIVVKNNKEENSYNGLI